ncbi:hypothetical protein ASE49_16165 [Novosphingobium sp. Leaf2]|nr:hypothetical protein ASE49_16165 [Novosphingobium sp. Leaf2]
MVGHDVTEFMAKGEQHAGRKAWRDKNKHVTACGDRGTFIFGVLEFADDKPIEHSQALRKIDRWAVDFARVDKGTKLGRKPLSFVMRFRSLKPKSVEPIGKTSASGQNLNRRLYKTRQSVQGRFTL